MNKFLPTLIFAACLMTSTHITQLKAYSSTSSHDGERGAWGGNGGYWGNSRNDWYGEYGTPEENENIGHYHYTPPHYSRYGYNHGYYSGQEYSHHGHDNSNNVDGAALYFSIPQQ